MDDKKFMVCLSLTLDSELGRKNSYLSTSSVRLFIFPLKLFVCILF